ncbi:2-oxoglutarate (2OG) and Fe(II)-dependent oxygenase superfamily protein [Actinidia rufa]|uniref:2-oxoglutarate (2OG) and Fe(II)-dependent oxygenase superfamily protein n=1 Tax=Actinidia rufa TaxID=165716 RepID=A0A7J0FC83_9ERIC|nr:2-oxoglutarate (2OG) and Fe(II)-dependent oxygenase superfamily protein [Actinidia rufa]
MSCSVTTAPLTLRTVSIPFSDLHDKNIDLSPKIEEGFGPNGLGILTVSDVPGYSLLRQNLLRLSTRLASLPEDVKKELEDPNSRYNFGWSHGKEKLESGKPDILKGSFYANPILDIPTTDASLVQRYPSYCGSNIWPDKALPELELVSRVTKMHENEGLEPILLRSRCHKGRLLYYFPSLQSFGTQDGDSMSSWCGWHTDHGSLTAYFFYDLNSVPNGTLELLNEPMVRAGPGNPIRVGVVVTAPEGSYDPCARSLGSCDLVKGLTCGMFMRDAVEIPCPDSAAGLYIKTRTDQIVKVVFGEDEIAYQIGETTEILSRGHLCATPHCVRAPKEKEASGLERSTFALFMQPDW